MKCASCAQPLYCAECGRPFRPRDEREYRALHEPETPLVCPACEAPLVCRWCGYAYTGDAAEFGE